MAASRAVVATPVDGARDLVEDGVNGYLAASISSSALADAMRRAVLAGRSRRETQGRAGRALLEERFSVDAMVEQLDAVYREALEASSLR
jgi:glycosyltransferase involved in cell wall biosynthesis